MKKYFILFILNLIFVSFVNAAEMENSVADEQDMGWKEKLEGANQEELNIYSARKEEFLSEILKKFSEENNVKINFKNDNVYKLLESLKNQQSNVDLLITSDAASIQDAKENDLLEKSDCAIYKDMDNFFLDGDCYWTAVSFRARVIAYSKKIEENIQEELKNYDDLVKKDREGRMIFLKKILLTPSSSPYNQFFTAYMMFIEPDFADEFIVNLRRAAYRNPSGSDTENIKSIAHGNGELSLVNSYYYFRLLFSDDVKSRDVAEKVGIIFPNQSKNGTHINFSTIGVVKNSKNKELAEKFIKFLLSEDVQKLIVEKNREYSVNQEYLNVELNSRAGLKNVKFDFKTNLIDVSKLSKPAYDLLQRANWH